jgi:phosphoenolpyruvate synthase/pyruvate phosphate dikinase
VEENPMLGRRGASRYYRKRYRDAFALACRAIGRVREEIGLANVVVMIPFCRTLAEADRVLAEMARHRLERGRDGLKVYVIPNPMSWNLRPPKTGGRPDGRRATWRAAKRAEARAGH